MNQNGYVTWKNLLTVVGITCTLAIAFNTAIWLMHGREQAQFEKRMDIQFLHISEQLNKIESRLPR